MHPSHRALRSPAEVLFLDWQGEKRIAGTPRLPFPRQAGGKGTRKNTPCSHDNRFLDRQGGKGIASARHVPMITFSSTGRGKMESKSESQAPHDCLFLDRQGEKRVLHTIATSDHAGMNKQV